MQHECLLRTLDVARCSCSPQEHDAWSLPPAPSRTQNGGSIKKGNIGNYSNEGINFLPKKKHTHPAGSPRILATEMTHTQKNHFPFAHHHRSIPFPTSLNPRGKHALVTRPPNQAFDHSMESLWLTKGQHIVSPFAPLQRLFPGVRQSRIVTLNFPLQTANGTVFPYKCVWKYNLNLSPQTEGRQARPVRAREVQNHKLQTSASSEQRSLVRGEWFLWSCLLDRLR